MQQGFRTQQEQRLQLRVDPRLVLSGQLLEMNSVELQQMVQTELVENPALEWLDEDGEPMYLETILKSVNPSELKPSSEDREFQRSRPNDAEEHDWTDFAGSGNTLEAHLEAQLLTVLRPEYHRIAQIVVGSLDDRGYLVTPAEEIALDHSMDLDEVEFVISALHDCEPAGIGARDLRECLMLQLRRESGLEYRLAYGIVKHCFEELVDRNVRAIARRFRVLPDVAHQAFELIRSCRPFPADGFDRLATGSQQGHGASVTVDLRIIRSEQGWSVEVGGINPRDLIVSHPFREQMLRFQNGLDVSSDERKHLNAYIQRAKMFIDAMDQRYRTLMRIGLYMIEKQLGFVTTGEFAFLKPLTRRQMAQDLGLHESTISRATTGKHLQLANGEVVSFEVFFKPALRIQQMIGEILSTEDPDVPLSDERIAQILAERGVQVARRTVNKYRDRSKLLSSRRRRSA